MPSTGQNLQPITGNGDVSIWMINSRVGQNKNKQQQKPFTTASEHSAEQDGQYHINYPEFNAL